MKKQDLNDLKTKSVDQLNKKITELEKGKINSQLELKMGKAKNVHLIAQKRKDIAQTKTILKMKLLASRVNPKNNKEESKDGSN